VTGAAICHRGAHSNLARQIAISMMGFNNVLADGQGFKARLLRRLDVVEDLIRHFLINRGQRFIS
jgi:hypothetical protein